MYEELPHTALRHLRVLFPGDLFEVARLELRATDALYKGKRSKPQLTVNGLAGAGRSGGTQMKNVEFNDLIKSVRQAGKIKRSECSPARTFRFAPENVRQIRNDLGLSQSEFALLIGVSTATLQNWEQGRRQPEGPARALLRIAASNPQAVLDALQS